MWIKQGNIFADQAQLPTPIVFGDSLYVYFSHRVQGESHIGLFILDKNLKVTTTHNSVILPGERGCFDDSGVMPSFACVRNGKYWLYYSGWNCDKGLVPYGHGIGVATSDDGLNYTRHSNGPILDRTTNTPFLVNSPVINGNKMFFCNGCGWSDNFPRYFISSATSIDGIVWEYSGQVAGGESEATSRPWVLTENNVVKMWASVKTTNTNYRIKYFEDFSQKDDNVIKTSNDGWDSDMTCYPAVVDFFDRIMLYNGNGFGASGVGYAVWE